MIERGSVVGERWEVLELIGQGGMGEVYRARHRLTQRMAALKVLRATAGIDQETAIRFQREASAGAQIDHPGIVTVLDAGADPARGCLFIAMELLIGTTLAPRMGPEALPWIAAVLEPLAAAHARGFVHRDLKPENIFVDESGADLRVKILDLGLARHREALNATGTGQVMGTPWYMAPEQAMNARDATAAADVWAVGVMIYEAVSGERPFTAASVTAHLVELVQSHHVPLSLRVPQVDPRLSAIVDRCLAKEPLARPADAAVLARELAAIGLVPPTRANPAELSGPRRFSGEVPARRSDPAIDALAATMAPAPGFAMPAAVAPHAPAAFHSPPPAPPAHGPVSPTPVAAPAPPRRVSFGCIIAVLAAGVILAIGGAAITIVILRAIGSQRVTAPGLSLDVPSDWERVPSSLRGALFQYGAPFDPTTESVRIQMYAAVDPTPYDAEHYAQYTVEQWAGTGATIDYNVPAQLDGIDGREVQLTADHVDGSYTQVQRVVVRDGTAWVVACVGPERRFEEEVRSDCQAIMGSVRFTE